MSDFIQQWHIECAFRSSDSWVILSPIEQSIKRKIEAVGTPLKNWNININYGIKTGYNDAFIINTEKREEILRNCRTEDERQRTAELIRPILRGRDIKTYGYNWDNLWLINTHNGIKGVKPRININEYSAVKAYLDQHWDKISKRADKGDTPYNLRNCAYMEDFYKPKIVWKIIGNQMAFAYDKNQFIMNNACYIMTGEHLDYLLSILNSQAILWYSYVTNMNKTGVGDVQVGGQNIITFPIPAYSDNKNILAKMADCVTNQKISLKSVDYQIENIISEIFGFTTDERNFLNTFANSLRKKG